ncbi:MAG: HNH endonuclease [Bdellovibrionota bacterium]
MVSWQKALILWFQGKVEILEFHGLFVRSARDSFQIPSVLRLKSYVRGKQVQHVRFSRENIYLRDEHTCQYCAQKFPQKLLTMDHVVPVSKNGQNSWTNVVTACRQCNQRKANRTPAQAKMPLLREPKTPSWLPFWETDLKPKSIPESWRNYLPLAMAEHE